jgi:hypothetical protein
MGRGQGWQAATTHTRTSRGGILSLAASKDDSRAEGWPASSFSRQRAGAAAAREQRTDGECESRGGGGVRESRVGRARALLFPTCSPLLPHSLFLSRSRPRALSCFPARARSFFPAPERLNRAEATLHDTSPAKVTPYSPKSWRHRHPASLLTPTPKHRFATPQGRLKIYGMHQHQVDYHIAELNP